VLVLGIETSCDETAVSIVDQNHQILSHKVWSQLDEHAAYGGVVPELAARAHLVYLNRMIRENIADAGLKIKDLDAIAATGGPGLIGGIIVGVMTAKGIAAACGCPFLAVNHLEGHALTVRLTNNVNFPYLLLLVSGGHCQLLIVDGVGCYRRLGTTIDDAVGETFDKAARLLGLGWPGGPAVEREAAMGDPNRFPLPRPLIGQSHCNFSFSGLKTAVRRHVEALPSGPLKRRDITDLAAALQTAISDVLADRVCYAINRFRVLAPEGTTLVVAGGVAANRALFARLNTVAAKHELFFVAPPIELCTDNGAMIAWAGLERLRLGLVDSLDFTPRPRWPLELVR
jgi:N6-L-threonylcarbamoyladenine synthase